MEKIAIIGAGNMGGAIAAGLMREALFQPEGILIVDRDQAKAAAFVAAHGGQVVGLDEALGVADVVVLAVKPQGMRAFLEGLKVRSGAVVLSVAAGVSIETMEMALGAEVRALEVVRAMPNTPAKIGVGATAFALGSHRTGRGRVVAQRVFGATGLALEVEEAELDAVTALSGSGPAYVFRWLEAAQAGGEGMGLSGAQSRALATQTLLGAAMLAQDGDPAALREAVTSPGGTTEAALRRLRQGRWFETLVWGMEAARQRAGALGRGEAGPSGLFGRVEALKAVGLRPVAVLDIDLTLVENGPRSREILAAWLREEGHEPGEAPWEMPLVFSVPQNVKTLLAAVGLEGDEAWVGRGVAYWRAQFFRETYLKHDLALPGAPEVVQGLYEAGVHVVYLTARPESLAAATVAQLQALGFPIGRVGTSLWTRGAEDESEEAYKVGALKAVAELGEPVFLIDNEPVHVNAMAEAYPEAITMLMGTRHSTPAPPLRPGIEVLRAWSEIARD